MERNLHDRLETQLSHEPAQSLKAVQDSIAAVVQDSIAAVETAVQRQVVNNVTVYDKLPIYVGAAELRMGHASQPSLNDICGNRGAKVIVLVQWSVMAACLLALLAAYLLEVKLHAGSRLLRSFGCCLSRERNEDSWLAVAGSHVFAMRHLLSLVLYWFDIIMDIILLHSVMAARTPLGYGLLAVLLTHYVLLAQLIAWRFIDAGPLWRRLLAALLALPLALLMPLLDSVAFLVVATMRTLQGGRIVPSRLWPATLDVQAEHWMKLLQTRELLEVVLEAIPTAALQSIIFLVGNTPALGIYLDTTIYVLSSAGSCAQILRLVAVTLWAAAAQREGVGSVLLDRLSGKSARIQKQAGGDLGGVILLGATVHRAPSC
jgi:hypothetical protein